MNSDSDNRKSRRGMRHLLISLAEASARFFNANFPEYLARLKISRQQIDEEVLSFDGALTVWTNQNEIGIEREHGGRPVTGRIRMRDTAANRSLVTYLNIANTLCALRQQRANLLQQIRRFHLVVSRRRANQDLAALFADVCERFDPRDIDEQLWLRETQLHGRYQTVPTSKNLCAVQIARQQRNCFIERRRSFVIELCWNHDPLLIRVISG